MSLRFSGGISSRTLIHMATESRRLDSKRQNLDTFVVCHVLEGLELDEGILKDIESSYGLHYILRNIQESSIDIDNKIYVL